MHFLDTNPFFLFMLYLVMHYFVLSHSNRFESRRAALEPAVGCPQARGPGDHLAAGGSRPHLGQGLRDLQMIRFTFSPKDSFQPKK